MAASYDEWFRVMAAVKAACDGSEEGYELFERWSARSSKHDPAVTREKWDSLRPPYRVGWPLLAALADEHSGGQFNRAAADFQPVDSPEGDGDDDPDRLDTTDNMFERYGWIEGAQRAIDLRSGALLTQEQFNFRIPPKITAGALGPRGGGGKPTKTLAWTIFQDNPTKRVTYANLTCRFGGPLVVTEDLPGLQGECYNVWREPRRGQAIPSKVTDEDVEPWLALARHVVPNDAERRHVLDWMAFTVQHQGVKINHAVMLGSRNEGVGKDSFIEPLRWAVGRQYVRELSPTELAAPFSQWIQECKLLVVQEMHTFTRRETMNLLKPLLASPPETLQVNIKGRPQFNVPNLLNAMFFTNEPDALQINRGDRRYFVVWNENDPLPQDAYTKVWGWYLDHDGLAKVTGWLAQRDLSAFDAAGPAPGTDAKRDMAEGSRPPLHAWVEDGIDAGSDPFQTDVVLVEDLIQAIPEWARGRRSGVSPTRMGLALKSCGAIRVDEKVRVPGREGSRRLWIIRRHSMFAGLDPLQIRDAYVSQTERIKGDAVRSF